MREANLIITDKMLDEVWGSANFGEALTKREIINNAVLKNVPRVTTQDIQLKEL